MEITILLNVPHNSIYEIRKVNIPEKQTSSNYPVRNNQHSLSILEHDNNLHSDVFAESINITQPIYQERLNRLQAVNGSTLAAMQEAVEEFSKRNETSNQDLLSFYSVFCII